MGLPDRRPAYAKPDFNWLSSSKNGTWKRTCGVSFLRSLAPNVAIAMQHVPGNIHQSFATPRDSATPCYIVIQLPNVMQLTWNRSDDGVTELESLQCFTFPYLSLSRFFTPSRFKFKLLINNGIDWKIVIHLLCGLKTSGLGARGTNKGQ